MPKIRLAPLADSSRIIEIHVAGWKTAYRGIIPDDYLDNMNPNDPQVLWDQRVQ